MYGVNILGIEMKAFYSSEKLFPNFFVAIGYNTLFDCFLERNYFKL